MAGRDDDVDDVDDDDDDVDDVEKTFVDKTRQDTSNSDIQTAVPYDDKTVRKQVERTRRGVRVIHL